MRAHRAWWHITAGLMAVGLIAVGRPASTSAGVQLIVEHVQPSSAVADLRTGRLFVASPGAVAGSNGRVAMFSARTAHLLQTTSVGYNPIAMALDGRTQRLFVVNQATLDAVGSPTGQGSVSMLDAQTGASLRTVKVGRMPRAVAVDEQTRRVFVVNYQDGTVSMLDALLGHVLRTIAVGPQPRLVAVDLSSNRTFIVKADGALRVLDATTGVMLRSVP